MLHGTRLEGRGISTKPESLANTHSLALTGHPPADPYLPPHLPPFCRWGCVPNLPKRCRMTVAHHHVPLSASPHSCHRATVAPRNSACWGAGGPYLCHELILGLGVSGAECLHKVVCHMHVTCMFLHLCVTDMFML